MKLKKLLSEVPLTLYSGNKEVVITGVTSHSKLVHPGTLFVAKKGTCDDGSKYIEEAIASGAVAILSSQPDPFLKHVTQLIHPDIPAIEGKVAACYYNNPSKELLTIGVTGTSGKTSTTFLLKHVLDQLGYKAGLIGSIEYIIGETKRPADRTTPDVHTLHKMLREMVNVGCKASAIEVTAHGLSQGRTHEVDFDTAVFTNLTQDHLDYYKDMHAYAAAKALFFSTLPADKKAVVNLDDPYTPFMIKDCKAQVLTFGFDQHAHVRCLSYTLSPHATEFEVEYEGKREKFTWKLIGKHNIQNGLAVIGALVAHGIEFAALPALLHTASTIPGRLERVGNSLVFVDYAHKPDALEKVLSFLKEITKGRLITVFGCGGDRDQTKRPQMAQISEQFSDFTIVTSDNPRSEDPDAIIREIVTGFSTSSYAIEPDRKKGIERAIRSAEKEDLILIAGKGHEAYQIFSHQTIPFDDRKIAAEILSL